MPYPEELIAPMRQDLVQLGFKELKTPGEVDEVLGTDRRTTMVAINSVCGCSAGGMRPGVAAILGQRSQARCSRIRLRWTGSRSDRKGPRVLHWISAVVTGCGVDEGRRARLHAGAPRN